MAFMDDESEHRSMIPTFCVFFLVLEIAMALVIFFGIRRAYWSILVFYITVSLVVVFLVLVCFDAFIKSIPAKARESNLSDPSGNEAFLIRLQD